MPSSSASRASLSSAERGENERDRVVALRAERGPERLQLAPSRADNEDRPGGLAQEVEQVEERRLGPVQVLEDEHERPLPREQLEHAADAPVELGL